jgi:hypothetical protein
MYQNQRFVSIFKKSIPFAISDLFEDLNLNECIKQKSIPKLRSMQLNFLPSARPSTYVCLPSISTIIDSGWSSSGMDGVSRVVDEGWGEIICAKRGRVRG